MPVTRSHHVGTSVARSLSLLLTAVAVLLASTLTGGNMTAAAAPTGWTQIVSDDWDRTLTDTWGSALTGGAYKHRANGVSTSVPFNVADGKGSVAMVPGNGYTATLPVSASDSRTKLTFVVPSLTSIKSGLHQVIQARLQGTGAAYRGRVFLGGSGSVTLGVSRVVAENDVGLAEYRLPLTVTAGNQLNLEFSVTGTDSVLLQSRAWLDAVPQPDWQSRYTDTSSSKITNAGALGLWIYQSSGGSPFTLLNTRLQAWSPPSGVSMVTAPTTTTKAPTPAAASTGRGVGTVGTASFPVPTGSRFVATNGNDKNAGTQSAPFRTLAAGLAQSTAGSTIVLRAGSYNESVTVDKADVTIQNYPGETVWLDGSIPVSNWTKSGTAWVASGWTTEFDRIS